MECINDLLGMRVLKSIAMPLFLGTQYPDELINPVRNFHSVLQK